LSATRHLRLVCLGDRVTEERRRRIDKDVLDVPSILCR